MSEEKNENVDSQNDAGEVETPEEETTTEDSHEEREELTEREKQFLARAKKAESKLKEIKSSKGEDKPELKQPNKNQDEPDYARLAFLEQRKISHPDDQKMVVDEAARLKLPLTDILGMDYIKSRLKNAQDQRESQEAIPRGKGRSSGNTKNDVDYWIANGKTPDDVELAEKVIDARMKKDTSQSMFAEIRNAD
jgi:hypothetical protein